MVIAFTPVDVAIPELNDVIAFVETLYSAKLLMLVVPIDVNVPPIYSLFPFTANALTVLFALGLVPKIPLVEIL